MEDPGASCGPKGRFVAQARSGAASQAGPSKSRTLAGGLVVLPLPGRPTIRYLGAFAPNARLRPLVVKAEALAPRRRDKPEAAGHDCPVALTDAELAHHAVEQARRDPAGCPGQRQ